MVGDRWTALALSTGRRIGFFVSLCGLLLVPAGLTWADGNLRIPMNDAGIFDPAREPLSVGYELLTDAEDVVVRVRDFRGQVVNQYRFVELLAGDHAFIWDGRNANEDRLPDGNYELVFEVRFKDGSRGRGLVTVRIATIPQVPGAPAPELLPPEKHVFKINGSVSSLWRHDGENHEDTGQVRMRTRFSYADDNRRADGVFAAIDTYPGGDTNFDASQAFAEQRWESGKIKGVFREGLGAFDDPIKLFSDFKSERKKFGFRLDQTLGALQATGLAYSSEGDEDTDGSGAAARLRYGEEDSWQLGVGFTHREALLLDGSDDRYRNQAMAVDLRVPLIEALTLSVEFVHTEDSEKSSANGYTAIAAYDEGRLRLSAGYIDLGEDFAADFADPLHGVTADARGIEASADYSVPSTWRYFRNPIMTMRFFDLKRHSDDETVREIDTSLRFAIGERDTFFLNWYGQENEDGTTHTFLGTVTHQWNPWWTSSLQANHIDADDSGTWRFTLDTTYRREEQTARMALEWIRRTIDASVLSPYEEASLRLDWDNTHWGVQLQTRYSENEDDNGYNFFGRVEYRHEMLHRYQMTTYAALGNRSAFDFEKQVEIGGEFRF
jgi:FlgD Ig-like domain